MTPKDTRIDDRRRVPIFLEVEYRTAGSFLLAYSINLSTGGMFLETDQPLPVGSPLALRFTVPGSDPIEVQGQVAWVRKRPDSAGPAGMGIRFDESLDARHGEAIDRLVAKFRGLRVLVVAATAAARSRLVRTLRSMLANAHVTEVADSGAAGEALAEEPDLVLVELDETEAEALVALRLAKIQKRPLPVIAFSGEDDTRRRARDLGADEAVGNPPSFTEFQAAVLRSLSRPTGIGVK